MANNATVEFNTNAVDMTYTGTISGTGWVNKTGPGRLILTGASTYGDPAGYTAFTTVNQGVLQADRGVGLPTNSGLVLNGGVFQSNSAVTFNDPFWMWAPTGKEIIWNSGGFSAGGGKLTVNLFGDGRTINWGTDGYQGIAGNMILSSSSAQYETEIQNGIDLKGVVHTIQVDDNPNSAGDFATISGPISDPSGAGVGGIIKTGPGLLKLTGANTYGDNTGWTGFTTINQGVLQADRGVGLPAGSCLVLNGGVFQSNTASTFNTGFWYDWGFLEWYNGGFAGGGGKLTVNLYGDGRTIAWGTDGAHTLTGTMVLNSTSAQSEVEFQNGIDLTGGARTVQVDDNPNSTGDFATLSGVISDSVGGASFTKTGAGTLVLGGASANTFAGAFNLVQGNLSLAKTSGVAIAGTLNLSAPYGATFTTVQGNNQFSASAVINFNGGYWPHFELLGYTVTVANISDANGTGVIENTQGEAGVSANGVMTVNDSTNSSYSGYIRDGNFGGSSGKLVFVKGGTGTLTLTGGNCGGYTGGLTVNAGTLDYSGGALPVCNYTLNGGTLNIGALSQSIGTFSLLGGTLNGTGALSSNAAYDVRSGTVNAVLAGSVGLTKNSNNTATVNAPTYTGVTTVVAGQLNFTGALPGGAYTINGGVLNINALSKSIGAFQITGGTLSGTGALTSSAAYDIQGGTVNAVLAGGVGLNKTGTGTAILAAADTYTGTTAVSTGTLQIGNGATSGSLAAANASVAAAGTLAFYRSDAYAYAGAITGSGTVLIRQANNSLNLGTAYNTSLSGFSGTTSIQSAVAYVRSANAFGSSTINVVSGACISLWNTSSPTITNPFILNGIAVTNDGYAKPSIYGDAGYAGGYTVSGQITLAATSDVGNYGGNGTLTLGGRITGAGGLVLGKASPTLTDEYGSITIAGMATNDYSGGTTINRGTVYLAKLRGGVAIPGNLTIATPAAGTYGSYPNTYLKLAGVNQIASSSVMTFSGVYGSQWAYFEMLGNNLTVAGISDSTSAGVIENSETETGINTTATLTVNNTTSCSYSGFIRNGDFASSGGSAGLLALVKSGAGTLTLTGGNVASYTGGLTVNGGLLNYSGATALPGTPSQYNGSSGLTGPTSPVALTPCPYTLAGGTLNIGALSASIGTFQLAGGTVSGTGTLTSNTAYDVQSGSDGAVLAGSVNLNKTTAGLATIGAAPTYTGVTSVSAGTLNFTAGLPGGSYAISGGTLNINALSKSIGAFQLTGGTVTGSGALTSSSAYDIQTGTVSAVLAGSVGLNKTSGGAATINSPTYTGLTNLSAGTLNFTGALPGGNYTVSGGALNINALSRSIGTFQITGGSVIGTGTLTSNAAYDVRGGTVGVSLAGSSIGLTKSTSAAAVLTGADSYTGRTTVTGGTLELGLSAENCVLSLGGADIQSGVMAFDYAGGADPVATIRALLAASYDGGQWDVGQFRDSKATATGLTLAYMDDTSAKQVKVMATYPGDFNLDGVVNNLDKAIWAANAFTGSTWQKGDANYDGIVNGRDRDLLSANLGLPQLSGGAMPDEGVTPVPEPGTLALLAAGLIGVLVCAWRKRK